MDITIDPKRKKNESEPGSEKQSQDNIGRNTEDLDPADNGVITLDGIEYKMGDDLRGLPEIDHNDPTIQKWFMEQEVENLRKYGKLSCEEVEYMYARRLELQKDLPQKSVEELNHLALKEFREAKYGTPNVFDHNTDAYSSQRRQ